MKLQGSELKRGDYISLGKAVAKFNRTINELKQEENKTYLPEEIKYKDISERIVKKSELDRYIKNLRDFTSNKNDDIYLTEAGEKITSWEREVLETERKTAIKRMNRALKKVNQYDKEQIETLKSNIENMKNLENLTKEDFKDTIKRIHRLGATDYEWRKALQYRENYYRALESISNYENYEKFKKRLDRFKNPINFFNFIQKSETMKDLFVYYKGGTGLVIGAFTTSEDAFNYALENDYNMEVG